MLVWVEFAYLEPYSKKGYFKTLTKITNPIISKPKSAPALVDCIKWDTPIAVLANNNPGPIILKILENISFMIMNHQSYNRIKNYVIVLNQPIRIPMTARYHSKILFNLLF